MLRSVVARLVLSELASPEGGFQCHRTPERVSLRERGDAGCLFRAVARVYVGRPITPEKGAEVGRWSFLDK